MIWVATGVAALALALLLAAIAWRAGRRERARRRAAELEPAGELPDNVRVLEPDPDDWGFGTWRG